jgi:hypothetical protein
MYDQEVPILCALVAIVFLAGDRRTGALMAALCGVAWVIVMDRPARGRPGRRRVAFHRRRWSSPPPPEGMTPTLTSTIPDPPPPAEEPSPSPPPPVVEDTCQQDWNGEFVAIHTAVGVPRYRRGPGMTLPPGDDDGAPIVSPDLHVLNRERLPAVVAQGRNRRTRVVGIPTRSSYRSTTGGTSSFGHLR